MSIIMEQEIFKEEEEKKKRYPQIESRATSSADRVQDEKAKRFFPQFGWKNTLKVDFRLPRYHQLTSN